MNNSNNSFLRKRIRCQDHPSMDVRMQQYEQKNAQWIAEHPEASHADYVIAITRIALECGV